MKRGAAVLRPTAEQPVQAEVEQWGELPHLLGLWCAVPQQPSQDADAGKQRHGEILAGEGRRKRDQYTAHEARDISADDARK